MGMQKAFELMKEEDTT